jgi:hypothetical protein
MRQGFRVIDSDTRVNPSLDVLLRYADKQLGEHLDKLARTGSPGEATMARIHARDA